jgi:hypothetical protein
MAGKYGDWSMINKKQRFMVLFAVMPLLLSSCAELGAMSEPSNNSNAVPVLNSLPALTMEKGECITFLWAEQTNRPLIYTQNMNGDEATLLIDNKPVSATRTSADENVIAGFYRKQMYVVDGKTIEVRINPDPVRNIYEGIKIPNGVITIESTDGGRSIIPVSGMLGCNLEN